MSSSKNDECSYARRIKVAWYADSIRRKRALVSLIVTQIFFNVHCVDLYIRRPRLAGSGKTCRPLPARVCQISLVFSVIETVCSKSSCTSPSLSIGFRFTINRTTVSHAISVLPQSPSMVFRLDSCHLHQYFQISH